MPRLTAELILKSSSYFNPIKERELDLRGNKIAVIENLGATQDQYDSIDLSDNEIAKLENFPVLNRLRTLLLSNNRITKIANNLGEALPHLDTLILTNNKIVNLADIDPLGDLPMLQSLSLLENAASKKQHYRLYVIHRLPKLRVLDFRKIKEKERIASNKLFGGEKGDRLKQTLVRQAQSAVESTTTTSTASSNSDSQAIRNAIANAKSLAEVEQLTRALESGQLPGQS